ncbi:uncharacterized protein F5147DRAFT_653149 [Suillus discolor]|uniref:Uncharacterized protein n=1 Tax=Suillus discolor TaxID=1912936 RepID=A0A9P7F6H2_9AGAM|nr:uncharacterized protein F5147DRAFT_653149 [Suillus discolor]KAG2108069.1 hypothetical protein F5147DRAFT_653149 [Suillus discolor]
MTLSGDDSAGDLSVSPREVSLCVPTSPHARAKRRITALMEEVEALKQDKAGRAIRRMVALYSPIEDLVAENDQHCEDRDSGSTLENRQDRLQRSYIKLAKSLPWIHERLATLEHEESEDMLRKLKQGADSACGDDTGTLKDLIASWINILHCPTPLIRTDDKHHRGFVDDACGRLLCPAEWHWEDPIIKAGIRDRTTSFIVSKNLWPMFMYENYEADAKNLERGLMKSKLLVMLIVLKGFKAIFTPPLPMKSMAMAMAPISLRIADAPGDGRIKPKSRRMRKVTPRAIAYTACQIRFALSNITSWRTVDGDFDYHVFWNNIVDFFEAPPGAAVRSRINQLLEWWTRKVFGRNHREDLMPNVVSKMSVNALAAQRQQMEDAIFDSD